MSQLPQWADCAISQSWRDSPREESDIPISQSVCEFFSPPEAKRGLNIKAQSKVEQEEPAAIIFVLSGSGFCYKLYYNRRLTKNAKESENDFGKL